MGVIVGLVPLEILDILNMLDFLSNHPNLAFYSLTLLAIVIWQIEIWLIVTAYHLLLVNGCV